MRREIEKKKKRKRKKWSTGSEFCELKPPKGVNFKILDISGKNYLSWVLDAEVHLGASSLDKTITKDNKESQEDRSKALIFIRHHLDEALKSQYHSVESVSEYNSALFQIVSRLKLCGETITGADLLEKTYSTFHASNILLQQQYRERQFKKYSEFISFLIVAKQNNEFLLKNHQIHPTDSTVAPEMNATESRGNSPESRGKGHRRWLGPKKPNNKKKDGNNPHHQKVKKNVFPKHKGKSSQSHSKHHESVCHRCGSPGHWANVCRTARHLVDLYQASIKGKEKKAEISFSQYDIPMDIAHLDIYDFKNDGNEIEDMDSIFKDI
ncbi:uncharacterized protein LOC113280028 [Papaver somniferum]|uniref:uncharacterized protein LOC113280028 n=1 Tax=Papaver somniferum TaxID=3469 RepID=UPI000E6F661F|nr:uncharacterized protein LOC113280028 [Papaver somniferum]